MIHWWYAILNRTLFFYKMKLSNNVYEHILRYVSTAGMYILGRDIVSIGPNMVDLIKHAYKSWICKIQPFLFVMLYAWLLPPN